MKVLLISLFFLFSICDAKFCFCQNIYSGTNLRGRIVKNYYGQTVPMVSARVDLFFYDNRYPPGQQWRFIASTLTDAYGFYFFRMVIPNYYTIWVNQVKSYNIQVIQIDYARFTYQDLPQFLF